jgi:uncharacterized iron-regulated membrane protein
VRLPKQDDDPFVIRARGSVGPTLAGLIEVDRSTGAELRKLEYADLPPLAQLRLWVYPLHVGSVCGLPTKILAFASACVLIGLTMTGVWMWWERRPTGQWGLPRAPGGHVSRWVVMLIIVLSLYLPAVAISLVAIVAGDWAFRKSSQLLFGGVAG